MRREIAARGQSTDSVVIKDEIKQHEVSVSAWFAVFLDDADAQAFTILSKFKNIFFLRCVCCCTIFRAPYHGLSKKCRK